ncbi:MAG TPA: HAD family hydrolase [Stellaceae bacterium]|jgi:Cof subfamily protein (haloacid dehalogenase superfamily)|nr:HAD family hydrolase [Stellaceae bacterium]
MTSPPAIRLLLSDVDGTLVGSGKQLTPATLSAVARLHRVGILLSIASSRPPRGLAATIEALGIEAPVAAFNGGVLVKPDLSIIDSHFLPADLGHAVVGLLAQRGIDAWLFTDARWYLTNPAGPRIQLERVTVGFEPDIVSQFPADAFQRIGKIVGVSNDYDRLAACEAEMRARFGTSLAASRSQAYYLDMTHPGASKGNVVGMLSRAMSIDPAQIAAIGDGANDVSMIEAAGYGIAMGNAVDELKRVADAATGAANDDGFAQAVDTLILPRAAHS